MQVNTQNIQRPALFSDFFGEEIDYKNDYVDYIDTSSNDNSVIYKGSATSLLNNSEKFLKSVIHIINKSPQSHNNALSLM